jgi:hypothetical protein
VAGHDRSRLQTPQDPRPIVASEDPSRDPRRRRHRRRPEGPRRRGGVRCPGGERAAGHVDLNAVDLPTSVGAGIEAVGVVAGQLAVERDLESKQARAWAHGGLVRGAPATGSIGFPTRPRTPSNVKVVPSGESGRSDLNRRPFGPQPNALPGCATPRSPSEFTPGFHPTRGRTCVRSNGRERWAQEVRSIRRVEAFVGLRLAMESPPAAPQHVPTLPLRLPPRALLGEQAALHRAGASAKGGSSASAYDVADRVPQEPPMRRLW